MKKKKIKYKKKNKQITHKLWIMLLELIFFKKKYLIYKLT